MPYRFDTLLPLIVSGCAFFLVTGMFWFRGYSGYRGGAAYLALLTSVIAGGFASYHRALVIERFVSREYEIEQFLAVTAAGVFVVFAVPFAMRLWGRWIGTRGTPEEREPGVRGIRAWFSASNVIVGVTLVVSAWLGYEVSPFVGAAVVGGLLSAQAVIGMETAARTSGVAEPVKDLSPEREKIVSMLEGGKLTAEEAADLLQALGESSRRPAAPVPLTGGQRLLLIGAALVVVGFFLPWFVVNPGKEANRAMQQMNFSTGGSFPTTGNFQLPMPAQWSPADITMSGGDISRGLGWMVLALAVAAAIIPYVATNLDGATARTVRLLCLGIGGIVVLYLLTQNIRFASVGLMVAIGGYAVEIAGALRERRLATP